MRSQRIGHPSDPTHMPTAHAELIVALEPMATRCIRARGTILFRQGQEPVGVYIVRKGRVQLLLHSRDGLHTYRTAGPGHVLGLPATVANQPYSLTAKALQECELAIIDRKRVMDVLHDRNDLTLNVVAILAEEVSRIRKRASALATISSSSSR